MDGNINYDYLAKYIIVGNAAVGKSNLLIRFTHGIFKEEYQTTLGVEFGSKNINVGDKIYRIQIWDTAGQENFRSITQCYYKNSACAIIVYDITNRESFKNINSWIEECKTSCPKNICMVLVGNKSDLEDKRIITKEEGLELAEKYGILFFETSAKNGNNVYNIFSKSAELIDEKIDRGEYNFDNERCGIKVGNNIKNNTIITNLNNEEKNKNDKKCC